jgi:UDP-N-acetylmuramyl pentapeptide synthase
VDLDRLSAALGQTAPAVSLEITDLAHDTRAVRPGALFFCVPGATVDGHDLAPAAVAAGAVALIVEHPVDVPVPQLAVPSVREAMPPRSRARTVRRRLHSCLRRSSPPPAAGPGC